MPNDNEMFQSAAGGDDGARHAKRILGLLLVLAAVVFGYTALIQINLAAHAGGSALSPLTFLAATVVCGVLARWLLRAAKKPEEPRPLKPRVPQRCRRLTSARTAVVKASP